MSILKSSPTNYGDIKIVKADTSQIDKLVSMRMKMRLERNNLDEQSYNTLFKNTENYFKRSILSGSYISFLAIINNEIVGTSGVVFFEMPPTAKLPIAKVGKIMNMYTMPKFRNNGIGKKLLKHTITYAKEIGCTKIMLNSSSMGKILYEKTGFTPIENEMELFI